jgi:hypothetical protein
MRIRMLINTMLALAVTFMGGCGDSRTAHTGADKQVESTTAAESAEKTATTAKVSAEDGGWWCSEHGVPEGVCALCDSKVAAEFQKKGDWCKQHDRPESQCFICHPELEAKFAAQYEAKFGKKPPTPTL